VYVRGMAVGSRVGHLREVRRWHIVYRVTSVAVMERASLSESCVMWVSCRVRMSATIHAVSIIIMRALRSPLVGGISPSLNVGNSLRISRKSGEVK